MNSEVPNRLSSDTVRRTALSGLRVTRNCVLVASTTCADPTATLLSEGKQLQLVWSVPLTRVTKWFGGDRGLARRPQGWAALSPTGERQDVGRRRCGRRLGAGAGHGPKCASKRRNGGHARHHDPSPSHPSAALVVASHKSPSPLHGTPTIM